MTCRCHTRCALGPVKAMFKACLCTHHPPGKGQVLLTTQKEFKDHNKEGKELSVSKEILKAALTRIKQVCNKAADAQPGQIVESTCQTQVSSP